LGPGLRRGDDELGIPTQAGTAAGVAPHRMMRCVR
jgi:hypothetical protein